MQSKVPKAALMLSILLLLALAVTACAGGPPIVTARSACVALVPPEWRAGVPGAPFPDQDTVGAWIQFGDAQTGQLDKANDRTASTIGIVERCEARDRELIDAMRRPWWQFWR